MSRYKNYKVRDKIIEILYIERSSEIEKDYYSDEYRVTETNGNRIEKMLIKFLKENLSREKFEIANNYINSLSESRYNLTSMSNKIFYGAGFSDGTKM